MSDGGQLPWKVQKVDISRGPPGRYDHISRKEPLPLPPAGTTWVRDEETREWSLVKCSEVRAPVVTPPSPDTTAKDDGDKVPVVKGVDGPNLPEGRHPPTAPPTRSSSSALLEDAVEGEDYVIHTVLPSDTFSGLCLRYKISAIQLRQANRFSGTNLRLAPSRLVIPLSKDGSRGGRIRVQDRESPEYKTHELMAAVPVLGSYAEARAYLLMSGWDVAGAIEAARDDMGWEKQNEELAARRSDMVSSQHGGVCAGPNSKGWGHVESAEVEVAWRDEPDVVSDKECECELIHVDMAVPAVASPVALDRKDVDEEKGSDIGEGDETLRTPLLRSDLELTRVA